jgi:uncharacterized protein YcaQ
VISVVKTMRHLRRLAVAHSLFDPTTLQGAIDRLGFVQADPIRSPARAQDLILRHRVQGYVAGDLERRYPQLDVEEDYLYAYGFVSRDVWRLLHPRSPSRMRALERKVLDLVHRLGDTHPGSLAQHLGTRRTINAWGSYSKATTQALEWLHWRGLIRIARREGGVRVYQKVRDSSHEREPADRLRRLILLIADIFAPTREKTLTAAVARYDHLGNPRRMVKDLIRLGTLSREDVDGAAYLWPSVLESAATDVPRRVRFLAPFDPIVWDRRRFEHFWRWAYRFEAYTPAKKRVRGYYALPLLWDDEIPGWANVSIKDGQLVVDVGFVEKRPRGAEFTRELEAEIERMREFLQLRT